MPFKDPEKLLEYKREYYIRNRERFRRYKQEYYLQNKEQVQGYKREHYLRNKERILDHNREHRRYKIETDPEYVEKTRLVDSEKQRRYIVRYPEKIRARKAVSRGLKTGKLKRPENCSKCGETPEPCRDGRSKVHAHHEDYSRPLDVIWLCWNCHERTHNIEAKSCQIN